MSLKESPQDKNIEKSLHKLVVFEDKKIRRVFHNGEWYLMENGIFL
jgi:hypothetical protein